MMLYESRFDQCFGHCLSSQADCITIFQKLVIFLFSGRNKGEGIESHEPLTKSLILSGGD